MAYHAQSLTDGISRAVIDRWYITRNDKTDGKSSGADNSESPLLHAGVGKAAI